MTRELEREALLGRIDAGIAAARGVVELLEELRSDLEGASADAAATLCRTFADAIAVYAPRPRVSSTWHREARRLLELDNVRLEDALTVVEWLTTSSDPAAEFWRRNVLSVPTFRKQYGRLLLESRGRPTATDRQTRRIVESLENGRRRR